MMAPSKISLLVIGCLCLGVHSPVMGEPGSEAPLSGVGTAEESEALRETLVDRPNLRQWALLIQGGSGACVGDEVVIHVRGLPSLAPTIELMSDLLPRVFETLDLDESDDEPGLYRTAFRVTPEMGREQRVLIRLLEETTLAISVTTLPILARLPDGL